MNLKVFLKNKAVKNAGWLIGGKIAQMLVNMIVAILMARYLGPSNMGLVNCGAAYTSFFATIASLGINSVLVKEFIDHPGEEGKIIGTSLFMRAISSFLSAVVIVGIVMVIDADETTTIFVVMLCSLGLIFHIFEVVNYWFQSKLQSKVTAIVTLIAYIITSAYKVALMATGQSVIWFALSTSIDYICVGILLMLSYKKYNGGKLTIDLAYGKRLLAQSCHFILPGVMIAIYGQTDKIMLKQMVGSAETAYYATAVSLSNVWCFVLVAIKDSMYPMIMQAFKTDEKKFIKRNKQLYAIIFYISAAAALCYTILAKPVVGILYAVYQLMIINGITIGRYSSP